MVIYADILFAINFSMDFLALFICSKILNKRIYKNRMIFSSVIGGIYGVLAISVDLQSVLKIIVALSVALIMCLICFNDKKLSHILTSVITYFFISTSLGGIMSVIYSLANKLLADIIESYSYESVYSGAKTFVVIGLSGVCAVIFASVLSKKKDVKEAQITVKLHNKCYTLKGLCDSGNLLTEPFSGKRVVLVSSGCELGRAIEKTDELKKRYIPYKDVNGSGILKGVFIEQVTVNNKSVDVMVASTNNKSFGGYDALIPSAVL